MFGTNKIKGKVRSNGQYLRVVKGSPFLTIQGEGPYIGKPAVFLRLNGCNLRCWFCDTNFDNPDDPEIDIVHLTQMIMDVRGYARLVVITGGEPLRQNILPLCKLLKQLRMMVQIETAGTLWINDIEKFADVVVSPKTPTINVSAFEHAIAFKYVIQADCVSDETFLPVMATQPGALKQMLAGPRPGSVVFLSPMDECDDIKNLNNRRAVAKLAIKYNVMAGIQMHKFLEVD